jgi:hypothetical protein
LDILQPPYAVDVPARLLASDADLEALIWINTTAKDRDTGSANSRKRATCIRVLQRGHAGFAVSGTCIPHGTPPKM